MKNWLAIPKFTQIEKVLPFHFYFFLEIPSHSARYKSLTQQVGKWLSKGNWKSERRKGPGYEEGEGKGARKKKRENGHWKIEAYYFDDGSSIRESSFEFNFFLSLTGEMIPSEIFSRISSFKLPSRQ